MGLAFRLKDGISYPELICDYCGKEIKNWVEAIVTFKDYSPFPTLKPAHIYHKGQCDNAVREPYSEELFEYLPRLLQNYNLGKKNLE